MTTRSREEEHARTRERRRILREHCPHMPCRKLCAVAMSPRRTAETLRVVGVDPTRYGALLEVRRGGPPKTEDPKAKLRQARYAYLRRCGLSSWEATHRAVSQPQFAYQVRQLRLRTPELPPLPPELEGTT
jgi:hypothetical protein